MLDGNKPLLEPMLTHIYVVIWHHCFKLKARYDVSFDSSNSALCSNSAAPVIHGTSFHNACNNKTLLFKQGWVVLISLTQIYSYIAIAISVDSIWYWFTLSHKCLTPYFNNIIFFLLGTCTLYYCSTVKVNETWRTLNMIQNKKVTVQHLCSVCLC